MKNPKVIAKSSPSCLSDSGEMMVCSIPSYSPESLLIPDYATALGEILSWKTTLIVNRNVITRSSNSNGTGNYTT
ncbi:MAG TPA: hypothetical protein VEP90_13585, partial [Methylomirabilota bacterium]|nr:hypothetical protein [Methylomirabilota bacterium]